MQKAKNAKLARSMETIILTPDRAAELIEHNKHNRPLSQPHVNRISRQIIEDKWKFNGDTIKISEEGDILDGQHRCWAVVEAKKGVETAIITGIKREAFSTIDTLRKPRNGGDVVALSGAQRYASLTATALGWLMRYQRGVIPVFRDPTNRIENSDIEAAFAAHPMMVQAVERVICVRSLINPAVIGFLFYVLTNKNEDLANRMIGTLEDPAGIGVTDPFFKLRAYLATAKKRKETVNTIALAIKAINAAARGERIQTLAWRNQGNHPEAFPVLEVK